MNKHFYYRLKEKMSEIDDETNKIKLIQYINVIKIEEKIKKIKAELMQNLLFRRQSFTISR